MRRSEMSRVLLAIAGAKPREIGGPWPFLYSVTPDGELVVNVEPEQRPPAPSAPTSKTSVTETYMVKVVKAKAAEPKGEKSADTGMRRPGKAQKAAAQRVSALSLPDVWKRTGD